MKKQTIGLLHPGAMGAAVGKALTSSEADVLWVSEQRSEMSRQRAEQANLRDAGSIENLVNQSNIIFSVCPPASALQVANEVAELGFTGTYVDANAVAPGTARKVAKITTNAGASFVDGSIIGGPPQQKGSTRLYFSGEKAKEICPLFKASLFEAVALDGNIAAASALKMAFAAWTKGSTALLLNVRALARSAGVEEALLKEWSLSLPGLEARSNKGAFTGSQKAWRFVGEMQEIARTFDSAGLPDGFHQAATDVYQKLSSFKGSEDHTTEDVLERMLDPES